jgi:catechol 2,3-dioxygenase-like lactoylglutathione lyase family enzyme
MVTEEIYPMPSFPTLIVKDLEASSDFYQNALGFKHSFTMPGPGGRAASAGPSAMGEIGGSADCGSAGWQGVNGSQGPGCIAKL